MRGVLTSKSKPTAHIHLHTDRRHRKNSPPLIPPHLLITLVCTEPTNQADPFSGILSRPLALSFLLSLRHSTRPTSSCPTEFPRRSIPK
jgi:hypothetical protein